MPVFSLIARLLRVDVKTWFDLYIGLHDFTVILIQQRTKTSQDTNTFNTFSNNLPNFSWLSSLSQTIWPPYQFTSFRINFKNNYRIGSGKDLGHEATSTRGAVYVDYGGRSFCWTIKFSNLLDSKACLELLPYLWAESIAYSHADRVLGFWRTMRLRQKISAYLTNVLNHLTYIEKFHSIGYDSLSYPIIIILLVILDNLTWINTDR